MRVHLSLPVHYLDASREFYERLFGAPASKVRADYLNFRLDEPPILLALTPGTPATAGVQHFGIELPDHAALAVWRQRMDINQLGVEEEPDAECCYATGDKLWLTDPNGYRWEVWVRTGEYEAMKPLQQACCSG